LKFQQDAGSSAGIVDCQYDDRSGMMYQVAADFNSARFENVIGRN